MRSSWPAREEVERRAGRVKLDELQRTAERSRDHLVAQARWPRTALGGYAPATDRVARPARRRREIRGPWPTPPARSRTRPEARRAARQQCVHDGDRRRSDLVVCQKWIAELMRRGGSRVEQLTKPSAALNRRVAVGRSHRSFNPINGMFQHDFWNASGIASNAARHKFSLAICNGCHGDESGTGQRARRTRGEAGAVRRCDVQPVAAADSRYRTRRSRCHRSACGRHCARTDPSACVMGASGAIGVPTKETRCPADRGTRRRLPHRRQ